MAVNLITRSGDVNISVGKSRDGNNAIKDNKYEGIMLPWVQSVS